MRGRVWPVAGVLALALAGTADAATYCVGVKAPDCTARDSAADAFASARADADRDTIMLGRLSEAGAFADATGRPVRVLGMGADATRLRAGAAGPALRLLDPGSSARGLRIEGVAAAPALRLDDGAAVTVSVVDGRALVRGGPVELSGVSIEAPSPALQVTCDAACRLV